MTSNKFFSSGTPEVGRILDFGGVGDCGFRAVAGSLLFEFSKNHKALSPELLTSIMQQFYRYFDVFNPKKTLDPNSHLRALLVQENIDSLVYMFAFVLRQMAVDYMLTNPQDFRGAFLQGNDVEGTSPEQMRKIGTYIDESAIAALSRTLNINIEVAHQRKNSLMNKYTYSGNDTNFTVRVVLSNQHYTAKVQANDEQINKFRGIRTVFNSTQTKPTTVENNDPKLSVILERIKLHDKKVLHDFNVCKENLLFKVGLNELTKEQLVSMYIKSISSSDYLQGRHIASLKESGNAQFFQTIVNAQEAHNKGLTIDYLDDSPVDTVVEELVHALARASAIDQVNINKLLDEVDQDTLTKKASNRRNISVVSSYNGGDEDDNRLTTGMSL